MRWVFLIIVLLAWTGPAHSQPPNSQALQRHACAASSKHEQSIESLAAYLAQNRPKVIWNPMVKFETRNAAGELATAWEIYCWVTDRISYNREVQRVSHQWRTPGATLKRRSGVCHDYAELYQALGRAAGLQVEYVSGMSIREGERAYHAWNAVCIGGEWRMLDSCWGAGGMADGQFLRQFDSQWFTTRPEQFLSSHYPEPDRFRDPEATDFMKSVDPRKLAQIRRSMGLER